MNKLSSLMKRKSVFSMSPSSKSKGVVPASVVYAHDSLLGLPLELLRKIIQNLTTEDWLRLCLTCKYLQKIIDKFFLYYDVTLRSKGKLLSFRKSITRNKKNNLLSLYVNTIEFDHPVKESTGVETTSIVGFQYSKSDVSVADSYISIMLDVINHLPNLSEISLNQISPGFQFPDWSSTLKTHAHEHNYYPSIRRLRLSSQESWNIALRPNLLWPFGLIEELVLYDMIIDSSSLSKHPLLTLANENGPLITKAALKLQSKTSWSPIKKLSLSSCSIASSGSRSIEQYFREVETLQLLALKSHYDILLSHCFPSLKTLYVDLNSKCFSLYDSNEVGSINVGNNNSNYAYYNSMFVPKFYLNYEKFTTIMEKLPNNIPNVSFINVSFTNLKPVDPEAVDDPDSNAVNNNLFKFLSLLSGYDHVEFIMLKNYRLHQSRTRQEWGDLLAPCFSSTNSVRVKDKDGSVLFSRNEKY